jgi:hypothetical protein
MAYNRLNELEAIGKSLAELGARMEDDLSHLPYSLVAEYIQGTQSIADDIANEVRGLRADATQATDTAIAALTQAPEETEEVFDQEGLPTAEDVCGILADDDVSEGEESRDQSETTEGGPDPVLRAFKDDQIVEIEHFEHEHFPMIDAQTCEAVDPRVSWDAEPGPYPEDASVFADDPAPEGYAPVTNPEADAIAGAHDYYSPEAQAAREREESFLNRFNPFRVKADA